LNVNRNSPTLSSLSHHRQQNPECFLCCVWFVWSAGFQEELLLQRRSDQGCRRRRDRAALGRPGTVVHKIPMCVYCGARALMYGPCIVVHKIPMCCVRMRFHAPRVPMRLVCPMRVIFFLASVAHQREGLFGGPGDLPRRPDCHPRLLKKNYFEFRHKRGGSAGRGMEDWLR